MKTSRVLKIFFALSAEAILVYTLVLNQPEELQDKSTIKLRWIKAYEEENWEKVRTGLAWSLSLLGAELPKGSLDTAIVRLDSSTFSLDLSKTGFSTASLEKIVPIIDNLKRSEEYQKMGAIDLARFLVLTLHTSENYYAITGAEKTFNDFIKKYGFNEYETFAVLNSGVTKDNRLIKFKKTNEIDKLAFIAEESHDSIINGKFTPEIFEVLVVMKNGQLRYAIYNKAGQLIPSSPKEFGEAGKPGKCMWCHESSVLPMFVPTEDVSGYVTLKEFHDWVDSSNAMIRSYRNTLHSEIDFNKRQDHTYGELLYISFMEPSLERLSREWKIDSVSINKKLAGFETHIYKEFPFLGKLYHRKETDKKSPYRTIPVPWSVREENEFEKLK